MALAFVTTNNHKFTEVSDILKEFNLVVEQVDFDYAENHDASLEEVASTASVEVSTKLNRPIILEDTGIFFDAYEGFPGALPKFVFNTLGYRGIFKLLENEKRDVYFKTVAAYCEPEGTPKLFTGIMRGKITNEVYDQNKDAMPYDRIFIADRLPDKVFSRLSITEKNKLSQRGSAFRQFGKWHKKLHPKQIN